MFWSIIIKSIVVHTLTYFVVGMAAYRLFRYKEVLADLNMRPATHPLVRAGVLFQPVRGLLFGVVFYLLRDILFFQPNGWIVIWVMLVLIGIVSTFAPAQGSIEGLIYTQTQRTRSWLGLIEILVQSLLLSIITYYWVNYPAYGWLNWTLYSIFFLAMVLPLLGLLAGRKAGRAAQ